MDLYAEDMLAAAGLVLSATLTIISGISFARSRSGRLLVPLGAGLAVLMATRLAKQGGGGAFSSGPPGPWDLPVSAMLLVIVIILTIVWLAGGRAGRTERKENG